MGTAGVASLDAVMAPEVRTVRCSGALHRLPCAIRTRILFVDDEPDLQPLIRQRYRAQLQQGEVVLAFALNGREALDVVAARTVDYDVVVTDINMPVMNGLELLDELKKLQLSTVPLVLSAYGDMTNIRTAMNRGSFDFLTKPIDFRDLRITLDKALAHLGEMRERVALAERGAW
jgi:YesN/AraC family two-component response regulator